jgi:spore germination protein YaaH/5-hydroxyisourate hydrolase-like protein (transthyretin family)
MIKSKHRALPFVALLIASLLASTLAGSTALADNPPRKILTGWIPYYSMKTSLPAALNNADLIREVMPFWYTLKYNGKSKSVVVTDLYAPANPSIPITDPLAAMRGAGFQIIPTITDGTDKDVLSGLLANATSRTQIVSAIVDMAKVNNYDGVDLDFEGFAFVDANTTWKTTAPRWVAFVKELSTALHAEKKMLSVSTPYVLNPTEAQKGYYVYAWADIASAIDRLRIMTYDYSVAKAGPLGPITWAERTVKYAISIMPASKVFVGVPGYGRDWVTAVDGVCPANVASAIKVGAKAATFVMRDAQNLAASYGVTPTYNEAFGEMTFTYQKVYNGTTTAGLSTSCTATRTAWYQDTKGYALRAALVTKYRIGGISAWTLGMEEPLAMETIRQAAKAIAPDQVTATLASDKASINYGDPITLSGALTIKDKSPVANTQVRIEVKSPSDADWRVLTTAVTGADGTFTKPILISKSMSIRISSDATWERTESTSPEVVISVARTLSFAAPATVKAGAPLAITGAIRPRNAGVYVTLNKLVNGQWQPVGTPVTTDAQGNFVFTTSENLRKVATYKISVAADSNWALLESPSFSVIIR